MQAHRDMHDTLTFPAASAESSAPMDENEITQRVERRSGDDRRHSSALNDPRFWVSVCAVLLTIGLAVLGFIASQLTAINTTMATVVVATTRQGADIEALEKRVATAENAIETQKTAFNYNFTTRLAELKARQDALDSALQNQRR